MYIPSLYGGLGISDIHIRRYTVDFRPKAVQNLYSNRAHKRNGSGEDSETGESRGGDVGVPAARD